MSRYDLVGIGNAVVDIISQTDDSFLESMGIGKGIMQLVDRERGEKLYAAMDGCVQTPGGSIANTVAGVGALGLRTAFIGRVRDDALGRFYAKAMSNQGTDFPNPPVSGSNLPTSRSMIFISPDGERSMNTYLGISSELGSGDVSAEVAGQTRNMLLEGYLFDRDEGKSALIQAARECKRAGGKVGIAISDPFCVQRHRADFLSLLANELDYVIGNEVEIRALFDTDDLDHALACSAELCPLVVCTRSGNGATVLSPEGRVDGPVRRIVPVDATGAGDQFAAGFLFGHITGRDVPCCIRMGHVCAREVISHIGPRPISDMSSILRAEGLI